MFHNALRTCGWRGGTAGQQGAQAVQGDDARQGAGEAHQRVHQLVRDHLRYDRQYKQYRQYVSVGSTQYDGWYRRDVGAGDTVKHVPVLMQPSIAPAAGRSKEMTVGAFKKGTAQMKATCSTLFWSYMHTACKQRHVSHSRALSPPHWS